MQFGSVKVDIVRCFITTESNVVNSTLPTVSTLPSSAISTTRLHLQHTVIQSDKVSSANRLVTDDGTGRVDTSAAGLATVLSAGAEQTAITLEKSNSPDVRLPPVADAAARAYPNLAHLSNNVNRERLQRLRRRKESVTNASTALSAAASTANAPVSTVRIELMSPQAAVKDLQLDQVSDAGKSVQSCECRLQQLVSLYTRSN